MTTLEQKAAQSDGKSTCGTDCPLFYHCRYVGDPDSLAVKIAQLCSDKFREGYRKGYNQRKKGGKEMKAIKEILKQYHKVENAYIIANSEIGVLSRMVSDALGEELTADMCDGGEIEFRRDEYEEITLRIEDIIRLLEEKK